MSKPSEQKRRRQLTRKKAESKRKIDFEQRRQYKQDFPEIAWRNQDAPEGFVQAIKQAIADIDFRDRSLFEQWQIDCFKAAKYYGKPVLFQRVQVTEEITLPLTLALGLAFGQAVFSRIPEDKLLQWIPFSDVVFLPTGRRIQVFLSSLRRESGQGGTIHFSRHRPTIKIDGQNKVVGFSRHAIQRICERVVPRWKSYSALADAFSFFDQCIHFERADLINGQLAFTFYQECAKGFFSGIYASEVVGTWEPGQGYYRRVGYCPAVIEGDFIKAVTFLSPGNCPTPEYGLIVRSGLPRDEREYMKVQARSLDGSYLERSGDFGLLKWFHSQGVPQIIQSNTSLFMPCIEC